MHPPLRKRLAACWNMLTKGYWRDEVPQYQFDLLAKKNGDIGFGMCPPGEPERGRVVWLNRETSVWLRDGLTDLLPRDEIGNTLEPDIAVRPDGLIRLQWVCDETKTVHFPVDLTPAEAFDLSCSLYDIAKSAANRKQHDV